MSLTNQKSQLHRMRLSPNDGTASYKVAASQDQTVSRIRLPHKMKLSHMMELSKTMRRKKDEESSKEKEEEAAKYDIFGSNDEDTS